LDFIELVFPVPSERFSGGIPDHREHGADQLVVRDRVGRTQCIRSVILPPYAI